MFFRIISIMFYLLSLLPVVPNLDAFEYLPWDSTRELEDNLTPYLATLITIIVFTMMYIFLEPVARSGRISSRYTQSAIGTIHGIDFSGTRINNQPLMEANVEYDGVLKKFGALPSDFQFFFSIGDKVVVRYDPKNIKKSAIDLPASMDNLSDKASAVDLSTRYSGSRSGNTRIIDGGTTVINASDDPEMAELAAQLKRQYGKSDKSRSYDEERQQPKADPSSASAMIQIESITPTFGKGVNIYEVKGTVYRAGSSGGERVRIIQELQPSEAGEVVPGRVLQGALIEDNYQLVLG